MTDHSKLKELAEASIQAWDLHSKADKHKFYAAWCEAEEAFSIAASEVAVLALIAENEALRKERDKLREDRDGLLEAGAHLL